MPCFQWKPSETTGHRLQDEQLRCVYYKHLLVAFASLVVGAISSLFTKRNFGTKLPKRKQRKYAFQIALSTWSHAKSQRCLASKRTGQQRNSPALACSDNIFTCWEHGTAHALAFGEAVSTLAILNNGTEFVRLVTTWLFIAAVFFHAWNGKNLWLPTDRPSMPVSNDYERLLWIDLLWVEQTHGVIPTRDDIRTQGRTMCLGCRPNTISHKENSSQMQEKQQMSWIRNISNPYLSLLSGKHALSRHFKKEGMHSKLIHIVTTQ